MTKKCTNCDGNGRIPFTLVTYWQGGNRPIDRECPMCFGTGKNHMGLSLARIEDDWESVDRIIENIGIKALIFDVLKKGRAT